MSPSDPITQPPAAEEVEHIFLNSVTNTEAPTSERAKRPSIREVLQLLTRAVHHLLVRRVAVHPEILHVRDGGHAHESRRLVYVQRARNTPRRTVVALNYAVAKVASRRVAGLHRDAFVLQRSPVRDSYLSRTKALAGKVVVNEIVKLAVTEVALNLIAVEHQLVLLLARHATLATLTATLRERHSNPRNS